MMISCPNLSKVEIVRTQINIRKYVYGVDLPKGCMHSKLRDGSRAKLDLLLHVLRTLMLKEGGTLPPIVVPKIREEVQPHFNPSKFRQKLDVERNSETAELSRRFYAVYKAGVFTAWRCTYDAGRGRPENPEALVGAEVGQVFEDSSETIFPGAIVAYDPKRRWWKVVFDDGDSAEYNFRELTKLAKPPNFSCLTYSPTSACEEYLSAVRDDNTGLQSDGVFTLEGKMYKLVNVFCDEKTFIFWCAYCAVEDHCEAMGDYSRESLKNTFPEVEIAPYEDVKAWVRAYEESIRRGHSQQDENSDSEDDNVPLSILLGAFR